MTQKLEDRLFWLLQVSRNMLSTRDTDRLYPLITDALIEAAGAERGALFLTNRDGGQLVLECARNKQGADIAGDDFSRRALRAAKQLAIDAKPIVTTEAGTNEPPRIVLCVALVSDKERVGVAYTEGAPATEDEPTPSARVVEILADHAAAAIDNARLFQRATNDPLTGLPNNSYFMLQLAKVMRESTAEFSAGVLLVDLDTFKRVNLAAGAEAGDRALIDVASTLQDVARADGLVARYSSDKFAILLPPEEGTPIALRLRDVAERARAAVATKTYHGIRLSASIGGVAYPQHKVESAPDLIAAADDQLAKARARGRGEIEIG